MKNNLSLDKELQTMGEIIKRGDDSKENVLDYLSDRFCECQEDYSYVVSRLEQLVSSL